MIIRDGAGNSLRPITLPQIFLLAFLSFFYAWVSVFFLYHNDIGWHLATGDLILDTRAIPTTDPWSYTAKGAPWINLAWLWDIVAALIYRAAGGMGLLVLTLIVGVATLWLLTSLALRMGARSQVVLALGLLVGIGFPFYAPPDIFLCAAPQQMTLFFSALLLAMLWRFQNTRARVYYLLIPLLMTCWYNIHGGFIVGDAMLAAMVLGCLLKKDKPFFIQSLLMLALSCAAVLLNPYGIHVIEGVRGTLGHMFQRDVSEWQPLYWNINLLLATPSLLYTLLFLLSLLRCKSWCGRSPFHIALILLSLFLLIKGILVLRYFALFLLVSLPVTALGISEMLGNTKPDKPPVCPYPLCVFLVIAAGALVILYARNPRPVEMSDTRDPKAEIAFIMQHYSDARIINHWNYGSFLIFEARGALKPFIDGRMGTAYPDPLFSDFKNLYATKDWTAILTKYDANLVLWPRNDPEMLAWFSHHPEWKIVFTGKLAVVLVKN